MRGGAREPQSGQGAIEMLAARKSMMFAAAMLFVVAIAILAGLYIGLRVEK